MNLWMLATVTAVLLALRLVRPTPLTWMAAFLAAVFVVLSYAVEPPLPSSIVQMFMAIVAVALLAYMSADSGRFEEVRTSVGSFLTDSRHSYKLLMVMVMVPTLMAAKVYQEVTAPVSPPGGARTVHPAPPGEMSFAGKTIDLIEADNPYRTLESTNPAAFAEHVANGRRVYYQNCVLCHGDTMEGDGLFAHGFNPIPANFADATTIAMLQESYLFWRIAKGGPALPDESKPWSSSMPAWESFLSEEEIWDVILFLYDFTGQRPRAREEVH